MSWCFRKPEPEPEPTEWEPDPSYSDPHNNVSGRGSTGGDQSGYPHAEGDDPGEPMPTFRESPEFPGGHPGSGKRR